MCTSRRRVGREPRRALVRRAHREAVAPGRAPQHAGTRDGHPAEHRHYERAPEAAQVDEDRGRDLGERRARCRSAAASGAGRRRDGAEQVAQSN